MAGCPCCPDYTEEELLDQLARRRMRWEEDWQSKSDEERQRDRQKYVKTNAHLDELVLQVQTRLERRMARTRDAEQPSV